MKRIITGRWIACILLIMPLLNFAQQLTQAEYFIDNDPGLGNGTILNINTPGDSVNFNFTVPLNSLNTGLHNLFVRFKDSNGVFGLQQGSAFYVLNSVAGAKINYMEYFFDTDPGQGNGYAYNTFTPSDSVNFYFSLPISQLSPGLHNLFARFMEADGSWGLYQGSMFYLVPDNIATQINALEYFFDADPGIGNGTAVPVIPAGDSTNMTFGISTIGLGRGRHHLFVRYSYADSTWGLYQGGQVLICNPPPANVGAAGNTTFCRGNSVILSANTSDTISYQWLFNGNNIAGATDSIFAARDFSGFYTVVVTDTIGCKDTSNAILVSVLQPPVAAIITVLTAFCAEDSLLLQAQTGSGVSYQWQYNGHNIAGATDSGYFARAAGNYAVIESKAGCPDTSAPLSLSPILPSTDSITAQICTGGSYNFHGRVLTINGAYLDTLTGANGCDSILTLFLEVRNELTTNISGTICKGSFYNFNGKHPAATGVYYDTLTAQGGCDSIITLNLTVLPALTSSYTVSVCAGNVYNFNGVMLNTAGVYSDTLINAQGCDSIVSVTFTVNPNPTASVTLFGQDTLVTGTFSTYQWLWNNNIITDANTQTYIAPVSGFYNVVVTDANGCADTTSVLNVVLGLNDLSIESSLLLYPNPASDLLIAESGLFDVNTIIPMFYDVAGKLVTVPFIRQTNKFIFNTNTLSPGMYSIRFNINNYSFSKKFVKAG